MNKLTKLGLTAVAGSLVASSAYAGALDVSGSATIKYKSDDDDEVTGNAFSMGKGISFSGSGELDNGYTMSYSYTMTNAAFSSQSIMLDMGDAGSIGLGNGNSGAGLQAHRYVIPTAGEEVWDDTDTDDNGLPTHSDSNAVYYNGSFGGFGISAAYVDDSAESDNSIVITYSGLVDGLTVGYGQGEDGSTVDLMTAYAKYTVGSITAAVQRSERDLEGSASDETSTGIGVSLAVNENLSLSYGIFDVEMGTGKEDEESRGISASYTSGGMKVVGVANATDSVAGTAGDDDTFSEISVSFSF